MATVLLVNNMTSYVNDDTSLLLGLRTDQTPDMTVKACVIYWLMTGVSSKIRTDIFPKSSEILLHCCESVDS